VTTAERVQAVVDYGFTERQARFLVLVMRHGGVCVKRQYAAFAGIANGGEKCNAFFTKLVRRGYAVATDCIHNRAQLYHVHHKPLYQVVGEPDSRFRRAVPARAAAERLLRLDAALISPDLEWLTTRAEKLTWLQARIASVSCERPGDVAVSPDGATVSQCPGTFPIGIDARGHLLLLYLATVPWTDDFRTFLIGHTDLLAATTGWTLRIVFPPALRRTVAAYQTVIHEEFEQPLPAAHLTQLRHHFFHRRRGTDLSTLPDSLRTTLRGYAEAFGGQRFTNLYRRWLTAGDAVLTPAPTTIPEALASGRGHVEDVVLQHSYDHLIPLVDRRRWRGQRQPSDGRRGEQRGAQPAHSVNPLLNPGP
jgi:hypothetical protein